MNSKEQHTKYNELLDIVAFCILMENNEGILGKSPDYLMEKFNRYVGKKEDSFKWGLDSSNTRKLESWWGKWMA